MASETSEDKFYACVACGTSLISWGMCNQCDLVYGIGCRETLDRISKELGLKPATDLDTILAHIETWRNERAGTGLSALEEAFRAGAAYGLKQRPDGGVEHAYWRWLESRK